MRRKTMTQLSRRSFVTEIIRTDFDLSIVESIARKVRGCATEIAEVNVRLVTLLTPPLRIFGDAAAEEAGASDALATVRCRGWGLFLKVVVGIMTWRQRWLMVE